MLPEVQRKGKEIAKLSPCQSSASASHCLKPVGDSSAKDSGSVVLWGRGVREHTGRGPGSELLRTNKQKGHQGSNDGTERELKRGTG